MKLETCFYCGYESKIPEYNPETMKFETILSKDESISITNYFLSEPICNSCKDDLKEWFKISIQKTRSK